jgi:N-acyl-D-amino-acid deacylase
MDRLPDRGSSIEFDRGILAPGMRADVNVLDADTVAERIPEIVNDFPGGAPRYVQRATGYHTTIQSGVITFEDGESTGDLPGKLVRGPQLPG